MLIISELKSPYKGLSFWDIGVNLNKLLKEVKEIEGDADFKGASSFGNVRVIGGYGNIYKTDVKHIGKLEYAGKGLSFSDFDKDHAKIIAELKPRMINYIHKNFFPKGVENYSTQEILERFGINCKKDSDGMLIISEYHQPLDNYREHITYSELGIDENKLLMDIKKIENIADMSKSNATSLGNVKEVYSLILSDSAIRDISGLDYASWNIAYDYYGTNRASDEEIEAAKKRSRETFMKRNFPKGIENYSPKEILKKFGFKCHKKVFGKNRGKLVLSNFNGPISPLWDITKMGIDKDKLIENIIKIKKNASGGYENILQT